LISLDSTAFNYLISLESFQVLNLKQNQFSLIEHLAFNELAELSKLDLSHNKLSEFYKDTFKNLSTLTYLNLEYENFESSDLALFEGLPQLATIEL
jgi:Leucine-rich repeat (LRR) protein